MENLKAPLMLLASCIFLMLLWQASLRALGADQAMQDAAAIAQSLDDPDASADLLAKEYERSHPGKKPNVKPASDSPRTARSFADDGAEADFASDTRE